VDARADRAHVLAALGAWEDDAMVRLLVAWLSNCLALLIAALVIPAISYGGDAGTLLLAGLILGVVNFVIRPAVIFLTLPAVILSLGLALLAINALMLWLTSRLVDGFSVGGFWSTLGGSLMVWIVNAALRRGGRRSRGHPRYRRASDRGEQPARQWRLL
jgi:putative membrane protein